MVRRYVLFSCVSLGLILPGAVVCQDPKPDQKDDQQNAAPARETVAKPLTEKQKRKQAEKLRKELETPYKKWLNEDVVYIITDEERAAFKRLPDRRGARSSSSSSSGCAATPRPIP